MRKKFIAFVSAIYAFTLVTPIISFASEIETTGGEMLMASYREVSTIMENDEATMEQQYENNLIYSELTEVYDNNEAGISFDFAGGYINEDDNLVIPNQRPKDKHFEKI